MLPDPIELKLSTSAENSISWSVDGQIAIAAAEEMYILHPNYSKDSVKRPWHELRFRVDTFSEDEWPPQIVPHVTDGLFIGREQENPEISALAWSSPGLARHDRCSLAVLMTNGLLSIWVPGVEPLSSSGWKSCLSINLVIAEHRFHPDANHREIIRAFAWRPKCTDGRTQHIAVLTENRELVVLEVSRGISGLRGRVLGVNTPKKRNQKPGLRSVIELNHRGFAIQWDAELEADNGDQEEDKEVSTIYTVGQGALEVFKLGFIPTNDGPSATFRRYGDSTPAHGPIFAHQGQVSYFWHGDLRCLDISGRVGAVSSRRDTERELVYLGSVPDWDSPRLIVSLGASRTSTRPQRSFSGLLPVSFFSIFQMTDIKAREMDKEHAFIGPADTTKSYLAKAVQDGIESCSSEHSLNNKVSARFHGLATFGDNNEFVALLATYWPQEQVVYQLKGSSRTHMIISHRDLEYSNLNAERESLKFPWQDVHQADGESSGFPDCISAMGLYQANATSEYWSIILLQLCGSIVREDSSGRNAGFQKLDFLDEGAWSRQIQDSLYSATAQSSDKPLDMANALIESTFQYKTDLVEKCMMPGCSKLLYFDSDEHLGDTATCAGPGHTYTRCSLTLAAIQQPYISKRCEICARTFLNEEKLGPEMTLLSAMLSDHKHCPFCKGKFVG